MSDDDFTIIRTDPEGDKRRAIAFAARAAFRYDTGGRAVRAACRFALMSGVTDGELAETTGLPRSPGR